MANAFNYMFKDNKYWQKALVLASIVFLSELNSNTANMYKGCCMAPSKEYYILNILSTLIKMFALGYSFTCIKALCEQKDNYVLPFINLKNNFILGIKNYIAILFISAIGYVLVFTGYFIEAPFIVLYIYIAISSILMLIYMTFYMMPCSWIFAKTGSVTSYLRLKQATQLIMTNKSTYWKAIAMFVLLAIITGIPEVAISRLCMSFVDSKIVYNLIDSSVAAIISAYPAFVIFFIVAKAINPDTAENI